MSRFDGLEKLTTKQGLKLISKYQKVKIYYCPLSCDHPDVNDGFLAVCRNYILDSGITTEAGAKSYVDWFNS